MAAIWSRLQFDKHISRSELYYIVWKYVESDSKRTQGIAQVQSVVLVRILLKQITSHQKAPGFGITVINFPTQMLKYWFHKSALN